MTSKTITGSRTLFALASCLIATAIACGETEGGGSSETNFQRCATNAECPVGQRCEAQVCRTIRDAGIDATLADAGTPCRQGNITDSCSPEFGCVPTWAQASALYPETCPTGAGSRVAYQAVCGEYNAIVWPDLDVLTVYYFDKASGTLVGITSWVTATTFCTTLTSDFVPPAGALEPLPSMIPCTPPPGVDCIAMNLDASADSGTTTSDASADAARGDGGPGTLCSSDLDCTSGLKCCYPCGIPDCRNECMTAPGGHCPLIP